MPFDDTLRPETAALHTDLYQLTMLQAYHREGMHGEAVFDLFIRRMGRRNYFLACGLETVLEYLETLSFSEEALDYLSGHDLFSDAFLDGLADFSFTGDVYAVDEGTPLFADEPVLQVVAPLGEAQLVETFLLNQITLQTGLASKASRVRQAANGGGRERLVADFGMRRMHGTDAAMKGARAFYVAGIDATSNVAAGHAYGLPITGTMAHSYVEAHDAEMDAFRNFADLYPETILLVDTYDTLDGVRKVIRMAEDRGDAFRVQGIRLDSGDLAALANDARALLDAAGLEDVVIFASSSLDEDAIADLIERGAPIDGFGVGTRMGTSADQPYLDSAYKLCGYDGVPRMKLAASKSNLPGRKQLVRQYDEDGQAVRDVIATEEDDVDGTPLLRRVMHGGMRTREAPSLNAHRETAANRLDELPDRLLGLDTDVEPFPVVLSDAMQTRRDETRERLETEMAVQDAADPPAQGPK